MLTSKLGRFCVTLCSILVSLTLVRALDDLSVYTNDYLASGWQDWSWNTNVSFAATDLFAGDSGTSISVNSTAWAALSLKFSGQISNYAGLRFDIAGEQPDAQIYFQSSADDSSSTSVLLSSFGTPIVSTKFTSFLLNFASLPGSGGQLGNGTWDRINIQARADGAEYHLDNVILIGAITIAPEILSAEPLASNVIAVTTKGEVDISTITVSLDGKALEIASRTTYIPVDTPAKTITYLNLATPFSQGKLDIVSGDVTFTHTLPPAQLGSVFPAIQHPINPHIYGVNFPPSASYIKHLGVTLSRWGGNAVTAYNPFGHFTNAGNDWYFENRLAENGPADDWLGWVQAAGSQSILTVPALDWVSKDAKSYSYPRSIYPEQSKFDPFNSDAGSGLFPNGSYITPVPDPSNVYTPWNTSLAKKWLQELKNKPNFIAIDNEIEIAASTHQDMHPIPISYDEELERVVNFSVAVKEALPTVQVVAPSTCSWWFYWTSQVGYSDNAAHGNIDFLPWFLQQMRQQELKHRKRLLDYLDIHYYFQPDTSANDAAAKALRLRMTRSLWDPTYVDESWVGRDPQNHQPNGTIVNLFPRFKKLIADNYPGTKLSVSEWSSTNDNDITGGLLAADSLGIFGKYGLDAATYWATPDEMGPVGLAYWLYRGYDTFFASSSAQVKLANPNPDTLGVYAGTEFGQKFTLVIVNKDASKPVALDLRNVPTGTYFVRHFGGAAGVAKWQSTITLKTNHYIVVPPYTAVFLQHS